MIKSNFLHNNRSNFIAGIFDYNISSKKTIRENIENNFFDEIIKSVEFYSDEIVVLFTCLRFEIYIYSNNKNKLREIQNIFLKNKFKILFGEKDIINYLIELCSGKLSEIIGELQIEIQAIKAFESQLKKRAKLRKVFQTALVNADSFRNTENFYNNENYATIAFKIINDLINTKLKGLLIVGAGMMSKKFAESCNYHKEKIDKIFIAELDKKKSKDLKNTLKIKNVEIINTQQINNILKKVDVIFAAAGGKYKIYKHSDPLLIIDITCPPMFTLEDCSKTKIITMYDKDYKEKINQINNIFKLKFK
ncbi:MAG: hypothetical protein ISS87_02225 [Candidatus Pacebacteria bacterium]|nr:hypothetical protein [Candidatus Paceibacterota bacterium]